MIKIMSWTLPPNNILKKSPPIDENEEMEAAWREAAQIEDRSEELGARLNIEKIDIGPSTILFSAAISEKGQVRQVPKLRDEIAYALGSESVSIQAPIPGEKVIGISCARFSRRMVTLGDVL